MRCEDGDTADEEEGMGKEDEEVEEEEEEEEEEKLDGEINVRGAPQCRHICAVASKE